MSRPPIACGLLVALCTLCTTAAATDVYAYVDAQGATHYADTRQDARYRLLFTERDLFGAGPASDASRMEAAMQSADAVSVLQEALLPEPQSPAVKALLALASRLPQQAAVHGALQEAARANAIDFELLVALVAVESGFNARAVSPKGARGLMQLMPTTAQRYGVRGDARTPFDSKLHDPRTNIAAGSRYLRDLLRLFGGNQTLALAAYNAGEGAVMRAGNKVPNYPETQNYVKTVTQLYAHIRQRGAQWLGGEGEKEDKEPENLVSLALRP